MTKEIRLLDLQGLDTKMTIPAEMTLSEFKTELANVLKINPNRYSFSSNGVAIEDDNTKILSCVGESNTITLFNHEIFPEKSFSRYINAFPPFEPKCNSLFQQQQEFKNKNKNKNKNTNHHDILLRILSSLARGSGSEGELSDLIGEISRNGMHVNIQNARDFNIDSDHVFIQNFNPIPESEEREMLVDYDEYDHQEEDWNPHIAPEEGWDQIINIEPDDQQQFLASITRSHFGGPGIDTGFGEMVREIGGNLTDEQTETLRNICRQTGADLMTALQIFEACDHNEAQTTNLLLSMGI